MPAVGRVPGVEEDLRVAGQAVEVERHGPGEFDVRA
jgi:hypothetical protein